MVYRPAAATTLVRTSLSSRFSSSMAQGLTANQKNLFDTNGYLHIPNALSHATCDTLRERIAYHLSQFDPSSYKSIFSSNHQTRYSDAYFLGSGNQIRYFFEEKAVDTEGNVTVPLPLAINKIGHNLHTLDPAFRAISFSPAVKGILYTSCMHVVLASTYV
jgi:phytanoyl-CoA hydroxylase